MLIGQACPNCPSRAKSGRPVQIFLERLFGDVILTWKSSPQKLGGVSHIFEHDWGTLSGSIQKKSKCWNEHDKIRDIAMVPGRKTPKMTSPRKSEFSTKIFDPP